jgi:hypothetical protein
VVFENPEHAIVGQLSGPNLALTDDLDFVAWMMTKRNETPTMEVRSNGRGQRGPEQLARDVFIARKETANVLRISRFVHRASDINGEPTN